MPDTRFWFAKYEVNGTLTSFSDFDADKDRSDREKDILMEYIRSDDAVVIDRSGKWYFGALDPKANHVLGKFGREFVDDATLYDEEEGDFEDLDEERTDAEYVMFILHFEHNMIIYSSRSRVGHEQFKKYFAKGFENHVGGHVSIDISDMKNEDELEYVLAEKPVFEVDVDLVPSNPSSDPGWEDLDDQMQEMLARKLDLDVKGDIEKGQDLNIDQDLLDAAIKMSQTQYGEDYTVVYGDDGQIKEISAGDDQISWKEEDGPDDLPGLSTISQSLINYGSSFLG